MSEMRAPDLDAVQFRLISSVLILCGLYEKSGYTRIPNYGPYDGVGNSVCMKKVLG